MKHLTALVLCLWALLEPPHKNDAPVLDAPLKQWTIARYTRDRISIPFYFDTQKECEARQNDVIYGAQKICLPVNPQY